MAIRSLSFTLNMDTGQFTVNARNAAGAMKELSRSLDDAGRRARANASELDGSVRSLRAYVENGLRMKQTQEQLRVSQDQFVRGLVRELDTMGMNAKQLRDYTAAQLGLTMQTREIIAALDEKEATLKALAEEEAREAAAQREAAAAEAARLEGAEALLNTLREQIVTLRAGSEALDVEKATALGCREEYLALSEIVAQLNEQHRLAAEIIEARAEAEREAAEMARMAAEADRAEAEAANTLLQQMQDEIIVLKAGSEALRANRAEALGVGEQYRRLAEEIRQLNAAHAEAAERDRLNAEALREEAREAAAAERAAARLAAAHERAGRSAHGNTGAIVELNRIMHEATRGAFTQMTGSITILMNRLGMAGGLTLAVGIAIGVLHAMLKPLDDAAKGMEDLARKSVELGMSLHSLEDLKVLSELTGVSFDKVANGVGRLDVALGRARNGSKQTAAAFKELGVDISKNYTSDQLLSAVAEGMSKIQNGATKAQVATALFGRAGKEMIPILNDMKEQLKDASAMAEEYGVHNEKAQDAALQLTAAQKENKVAMDGLGKVFLESLGPNLTAVTQGFTDLVKMFIDSYRAGGDAKKMMDFLVVSVKVLETVIIALGVAFYDLIKGIDMVAWEIQAIGLAALAKLIYYYEYAVESIRQFGKVMDDIAHGNWKGAADDASTFFDQVAKRAEKSAQTAANGAKQAFKNAYDDAGDIVGSWKKGAQGVQNIWNGPRRQKTYITPTGEGDEGDSSGIATAPKKEKKNPAEELLARLKGELEGINGEIDGSGKMFDTYKEKLNNTKDPLAQAVKGNEKLKQAILDTAAAIDEANKRKAGKVVYDDLAKQAQQAKDELAAAKRDLENAYAGKDQRQRELEAARARRQVSVDKVNESGYKPKDGQPSAQDLADQASYADTQRAAYNAALEMRDKTRQINAELESDTIQRQREIVENEVRSAYQRIAAMDMTTEDGKKAYADYVAYVEALNKKANSETPFGKMAKEWGDLTGNMEKATANWMNSFVEDMTRGKASFSDLARSIVQDLAQIIIKAMIAKYVLTPIMNAMGLNVNVPAMGAGGVPSAAGDAMSASISAMGKGIADTAGSWLESAGSWIVSLFHGGGMVGSGGMRRTIDPSVFIGAPKFHDGTMGVGLRPDEVPAILQRGEGVFTAAQMSQMAHSQKGNGGMAPVTVNLNNQSGVPLDADHSGSRFDGEKYVLDVVVSHLSRPGALRNAIKSSQ